MSNRAPFSLAARAGASLLAAVLVGLAGCAGPPQVLRQPVPQKGQASRTESRMTLKNGKAILRVGNQQVEGTCAMTATSVEDDEVVEIEGRQVTKLRTTIITDTYQQSMKFEGENDSSSHPSPLVGETILRELQGGKWKNTLVGKEPNEKQRKELDSLSPPENNDDLLPEGPAKPGFTWKLDATRLRKLLGSRCTGLTGEEVRTFVKTTTLNGESCLLINSTVNIKGKMLDDDNNEANIEMTAKGTIYQSLKTGHAIKTSLTGTVKISGTVVNEGQRAQLEMSGPITVETTTKPK
jgi:hypothetical protein